MTHELKILPRYFHLASMREKTYEIRKNDRDYHVGDTLILKEWDGEKYTGREISRYVNHILYGNENTEAFGLMDGYCIMNLKIGGAKATLSEGRCMTNRERLNAMADDDFTEWLCKQIWDDYGLTTTDLNVAENVVRYHTVRELLEDGVPGGCRWKQK